MRVPVESGIIWRLCDRIVEKRGLDDLLQVLEHLMASLIHDSDDSSSIFNLKSWTMLFQRLK